MEAIAELIGALLLGLISALAGFLSLVFGLLLLAVEFVITMAFSGLEAAEARRQDRLAKMRRKRAFQQPESPTVLSESTAPTQPPTERAAAPSTFRRNVIIVTVSLLITVAAVIVQQRINERRIRDTKTQIAQRCEELCDQLGDDGFPGEGMLVERDSWNNSLELFVDEWMLGSMLVVRSAGPDQRRGTIDDLLAVRFSRAAVKDVAVALFKRGAGAAKDQLAASLEDKLFDKLRSLPDYVDYGDTSEGSVNR